MKKNVVLYKNHVLNESIIKGYEKIKLDCDPSAYDVVMLYDNSRRDFKSPGTGFEFALFDMEDLKKMGYRLHPQKIIWNNGDYPLLYFYKQHPDYQYYWMVEYDVYFNGGRWGEFFDFYHKNHSDLLATLVKNYRQEPDWPWWKNHDFEVENDALMGCFYPLTRFSNRALKLLDEQYQSGKWGYCEVASPTLLNMHGYKVSDFGEVFYNRDLFRYLPPFPWELLRWLPKNKLYHPVKNMDGHSLLTVRSIKDVLIPHLPILHRILKKVSGLKAQRAALYARA